MDPELRKLSVGTFYSGKFQPNAEAKIEKILQREADKMNMIDLEDFTSAFAR